MAYKNMYRVVLSNDYLGVSKEISASTRQELDMKLVNQKRIWTEKIQRDMERQNKEEMKKKAELLTSLDNKLMHEYENIAKVISRRSAKDFYDGLLDKTEYKKYESMYSAPKIESINEELKVPKKSVFEFILKSKEKERIEKENEAQRLLEERTNKYNDDVKKEKEKYEREKEVFLQSQSEVNAGIESRRDNYYKGNTEEVEKYCSWIIEKSKFPENFVKDFELQYLPNEKKIIVSFYLPNSDSIPKIIQHKYVMSRNQIEEVVLTQKKFEKFYNDIVYMCCLKTIKEIFSSDDAKVIDSIVYNGWIKYIDKSNGKDAESCIITIETDKQTFMDINIENVDYKECIKGLKGIFAPSILSLTPVVPYMNINREDTRFIESKEVSNIAMDGYNLATMPWEDFEYFVRELFDKMFNVNGGEVKVTQASHDGGVDAIAFDDDPIRGGKFVIQAKRYNNVVPVSAVRDLYGTMIHEGATKGILVTTSSYGKDSYEFAKDKPIKLINGQELLGLLNKYGYTNLKIELTK